MTELSPTLSRVEIAKAVEVEVIRRVTDRASLDGDLVFGARAIGAVIGLSPRTIRHYHLRGLLPTLKLGRKIAARRSTLADWLAGREAAGRHSAMAEPTP